MTDERTNADLIAEVLRLVNDSGLSAWGQMARMNQLAPELARRLQRAIERGDELFEDALKAGKAIADAERRGEHIPADVARAVGSIIISKKPLTPEQIRYGQEIAREALGGESGGA